MFRRPGQRQAQRPLLLLAVDVIVFGTITFLVLHAGWGTHAAYQEDRARIAIKEHVRELALVLREHDEPVTTRDTVTDVLRDHWDVVPGTTAPGSGQVSVAFSTDGVLSGDQGQQVALVFHPRAGLVTVVEVTADGQFSQPVTFESPRGAVEVTNHTTQWWWS